MEEVRLREEEERAVESKKARTKEPTKLSGRQLWETGFWQARLIKKERMKMISRLTP